MGKEHIIEAVKNEYRRICINYLRTKDDFNLVIYCSQLVELDRIDKLMELGIDFDKIRSEIKEITLN